MFVTERPKRPTRYPPASTGICGSVRRPARPFSGVYVPGPKWYRWWDFGNGTMSDLGSHRNDLAFYALRHQGAAHDRSIRRSARASRDRAGDHAGRLRICGARRHAAAHADLASGREPPKIWTDGGIPQWPDAQLFIGDKGMILSSGDKHVLLPEKEFADFVPPPQTIRIRPGTTPSGLRPARAASPRSPTSITRGGRRKPTISATWRIGSARSCSGMPTR